MNKIEPYFDEDGTLIIPFECTDHSHKYWKQEGKDMRELLTELGADRATWEKYTHEPFPGDAPPEDSSDEDK